MKNKTITITLIALLTISSFGLLFTTFLTPAAAAAAPFDLSTMGPYAIDATPEMIGEKEIAMRKYAAEVGAAEATQASSIGDPVSIGEELDLTVSDFVLGDYDETFVAIMDGTHGIILIEKAAYVLYDPITDLYTFPNPNDIWRENDTISTDQLAYLLQQFDDVIYPTVTSIFGEPVARGDEGQKVWVLIHNIRDESYYPTPPGEDPPDSYVAGYFSSAEDAVNNKNMFHMDSYDWENRVGPDGGRPYLYEGVFAHEFQHLVHFDQDPDEPSWVDEGLADLAAYLCGYGHSSGHIANYFVYHPITSLTFWGGYLEDYGACYLFQLYLYEKYGGEAFVSALVQEQLNGIEGIEATLRNLGYRRAKFEKIFDDWTIANYLDDDKRNRGKYGYETLEIGSEDTWGYTLENVLTNYFLGSPIEGDFEVESGWWDLPFWGVDWGWEPQPYTAHYYRFNNDKLSEVYMDGDDFAGILPYSDMYEWYSDAGSWAWHSFYQTFDIPAGVTHLNFKTYFEIEDHWDYGYVEVFNGTDWFTLEAPGITWDFVWQRQDNPNLEGPDAIREPTAYEAAGRWNAFTGFSGDWIDISMDLSPFAGKTIDLYFTTWQDGAYTEQMMYIDDIEITNGVFPLDDIENGEGDWLSTGWYIFDGMFDNGWDVTVITVKGVPTWWDPLPEEIDAAKLLWKRGMWVNQGTQSGSMWIGATKVESGRVRVAIISNHADHILTSSYILGVKKMTWKWWKWWK